MTPLLFTVVIFAVCIFQTRAQSFSCTTAPALSPEANIVTAEGFRFTPVVTNLTGPRGIVVDSKGTLLVVEPSVGISAHTTDERGCVISSRVIIPNDLVTHGIDVYDNKLYASTADIVYAWDYDPDTQAATNMQPIITEMDNPGGHKTRTVWVNKKNPKYLVISVGTSESYDIPSHLPNDDRAVIKAFDLTAIPSGGLNFVSGGQLMARGVRNIVGLAEDRMGVMHGADNAIDGAFREVDGLRLDISDDNPAESIFNLGNPISPEPFNGGYPYCFAVWEPNNFLDKQFQPGDWFVFQPNATMNDTTCEGIAKKPEVIVVDHASPMDIKFGVGEDDTNLYLTMHGRWHSDRHEGYKVVRFPGTYSSEGWKPTAPITNNWSWVDVIGNADATTCPEHNDHPIGGPLPVTAPHSGCFHPVGLAWTADGKNLYVTSDSSGDVYLVKKS